MKLFTERLTLGFVEPSDLENIHLLLSMAETNQYNTAGIPANRDISMQLINAWIEESVRDHLFPYVISLNSQQEFAGLISLRIGKPAYRNAEVSYKILPAYWNRGYATEAVKRVIAFGFESLQLHRIHAGCAVENAGSARVLEKAGMTREGRCRQLLPLKTGWSDNFEYAILENDER